MIRRACVALILLTACDKNTSPPEEKVGGKYVTTKEIGFFDSGCGQDRLGDGKLKKGTKFTLVQARDGCWNIKLEDEDEVYILPERIAPAS